MWFFLVVGVNKVNKVSKGNKGNKGNKGGEDHKGAPKAVNLI